MKRLRPLTHLMLLLSLLPGAGGAADPAPASETAYEVEVVVFENRLPALEGNELWVQEAGHEEAGNIEDAVIIGDATLVDSALAPALEALMADRRYRVLSHKRWIQNINAKLDTSLVRISSEDTGEAELDGTVRVYMTRFLRLDINLAFRDSRREGFFKGQESATSQVYRINDQRRIWANEINYFDHPKFGTLVRVSLAEKPQAPGP